jgi:hypothetical protein
MSDLLVKLAALRTEFNDGQNDLVRQFMPLVGYAISQIRETIVSESEIQKNIFSTMQFNVPVGAIRVFINRAAHKNYRFLIKNPDGTYSPNREKLSQLKFPERLRIAKLNQSLLFAEFSKYSKNNFESQIDIDDIEPYFFEILFDIAPIIMRSIADPVKNQLQIPADHGSSEDRMRYRVCKFIVDSSVKESDNLTYIEEFVHGAIMAESLFYSTPNEALAKMSDVKVFLDTSILLNLMGFSEDPEVRASRELVDLLRKLGARVRCFRDTQSELHGILYAVTRAKENGRKYNWRPGDVGDIIDRRGMDISSLSATLVGLEDELNRKGVQVEDRPQVSEAIQIAIDEGVFADKIKIASSGRLVGNESGDTLDRRLRHDIDCVRAIYQMRAGLPVSSLERCKAIFVTNASTLSRVSAEFFAEQDDTMLQSSVPICIGSSVFTMLMWLKATDRRPKIAKDRLVANSIAALTPSPEMWKALMESLTRMLDRGEINQNEFDFLSNAYETRTLLMTETEGDIGAITSGTVEDIRQKIMAGLMKDKDEIIEKRDREIDGLKKSIFELDSKLNHAMSAIDLQKIDRLNMVRSFVWKAFQISIILFFLYLLFVEINNFIVKPKERDALYLLSLMVVNGLGALSLFFVTPWKRWLRVQSDRIADFLPGKLRNPFDDG